MDEAIYHITTRDRWQSALQTGEYRADSLENEGFIHCSLRRQVLPVANFLYSCQRDLILLEIDPRRVAVEIRWEGEPERFPHIYGPLGTHAVKRAADILQLQNGQFAFPTELA